MDTDGYYHEWIADSVSHIRTTAARRTPSGDSDGYSQWNRQFHYHNSRTEDQPHSVVLIFS